MDPEFSEQERLEKGICLTLPPNADQPATPGLGAVVATSAYLWPNESVRHLTLILVSNRS